MAIKMASGPAKRRCLLCRLPALSPSEIRVKSRDKARSLEKCALTLCKVFGIENKHPFKTIYENAVYCEMCLKDLQEATGMLGNLEKIRMDLLRFQNRVYSKLGDNYFQIKGRDGLKVDFREFDQGQKAIQGKRFSFDEVVKVVYEKMDTDCLNWERFSNEPRISQNDKETANTATQTDCLSTNSGDTDQGNDNSVDVEIVSNNDQTQDDDWGGDNLENDSMDNADVSGVSEINDTSIAASDATRKNTVASLSTPHPLKSKSRKPLRIEDKMELPPEVLQLPFFTPKVDIENKIYCSVDPENCKRFFFDDYNLNVHVKSFHEGLELPHECPDCKRCFLDERRLKNHYVQIHVVGHGNSNQHFLSPYRAMYTSICEHCGKSFSSPSVLRKHVKNYHNDSHSSACSICGHLLPNQKDLEIHEKLHLSGDRAFNCVICDSQCPNSKVLKQHVAQFHKENPFICDICGKVLSTEATLSKHRIIHTDKYKCSQCEFRGSTDHALRRHMETHSTERPYACDLCGKTFKYANQFKTHVEMHEGTTRYVCKLCGQEFRVFSQFRRHEELHASTASYSCDVCGKQYKVEHDYRHHMRTHTEEWKLKPKKRTKRKYPRTEAQKAARKIRDRMKRDLATREEGQVVSRKARASPRKEKTSASGTARQSRGKSTKHRARVQPKKELTSESEEEEMEEEVYGAVRMGDEISRALETINAELEQNEMSNVNAVIVYENQFVG